MAKQYGFKKSDRLKSRKQIDDLFAVGRSFAVPPLRVAYRFFPATDKTVAQAGATASKRHFKKAVERNRIKRLLRESYRLQKTALIECMKQKSKSGYFFFMYTDKTIAPFDVIKEAMNKCLEKLKQKALSNEDLA